jgi:hypothetical protein
MKIISLCNFVLAYSAQRRIVAIGDLHGDYEQAIKVLQLASLVDEQGNWSGEDATLVQTGDIVDRGPDTIKLYQMMQSLTQQAVSAGGKIVELLGNHEIMNMAEDYRYVVQDDISTFGSESDRKEAFALDGWIGKYLRDLGITAIVNDTVYAHGGILPKWAQIGIGKINSDTAKSLNHMTISQLLNADVLGNDGPTWYRGYAQDPEPDICSTLEVSLKAMKVNRMVLGHTVQQDGKIKTRCEGRVILIDVGISRWMFGNLAALELTPGHARALYPDSKVEELPVPPPLI